ncbi:MAG: thiol-activated cytolysin family protein [Clostridiales bacterium]|nr:thiol-activated cytolysin family protein [Clostridiales bacterium]
MDANMKTLEQKQNVGNESENGKEQELFLKIEELNDAWNELNIKRHNLYNQKNSMDKQAAALNSEKIKQQTRLRKLKSSKAFVVFMLYFVAVMIGGAVLKYENTDYSANKSMLSSSHNEKINALDNSRDNMIQQINDLQEDIAKREEVLAQQKLANQQLSIKEELASQGGLSGVTDTVLTEENRKELDAYIASLNRYPTKRIQQKKIDDVYYYEVVQKYDLDKYRLSDSGNPVIYPGAIIRGDSLMQGSPDYSLVSQERTPITLTCSRGGSVQLEDVNYGTVKEAVAQLWNDAIHEYADKWEYALRYVRDEESLNMSLGIGVNGVGSVNFGISQKESTSTMAIIYTETFFTVATEPLSSATSYFQSGSDLEYLGNYEPAYVSSVDYGRMIIVLVTAEMSESELNAGLSATVKGVDIGVDIENIKKELKGTCKICSYGGDSAKTLQVVSDDERSGGLKGWWDDLINGKTSEISGYNQIITADDSYTNPVPLSYRLNYLSDNSSVPAVAIINDNIILKDTARLVTITLEGDLAGTFKLSDSADAIGYVVDTDQIQITKKGETSGEIQFVWDSSNPNHLTGTFNGTLVSLPLEEIPEGTKSREHEFYSGSGFFKKSTFLNIHISSAIYDMQ